MSEKQQMKAGWRERVMQLEGVKARAAVLEKIKGSQESDLLDISREGVEQLFQASGAAMAGGTAGPACEQCDDGAADPDHWMHKAKRIALKYFGFSWGAN